MKALFLLSILSMTSLSFANDVKILKEGLNLKVAEVSTTVNCRETDDSHPGTDPAFTCDFESMNTQLQKNLGQIIKIEGLNRVSNYVLQNSVEDTKNYDVKLRVYYY